MRIRLKWKRSAVTGLVLKPILRSAMGYTLIEVLVAGAVLGFVGTSLYGAFAAGSCVIQYTRENLRATQIMVQKLESVRLFTWSQVTDPTNYLAPVFVEPYDPLGVTNNCGGANYTGYVTASVPAVGDLPEAYRTNMRVITVTLCWTNTYAAKRVAHRREMQTQVTRNGMQNYIWGAM